MRSMVVPLFLFLSLLLLVLAPWASVGAQGDDPAPAAILWGRWEGSEGDRFRTMHPVANICVASSGPVHLGFVGFDPEQHPGYFFEPDTGHPDCRSGMGGSEMEVVESDGPVRVLVSMFPARVLHQPGVTPLGEAGSMVLVRGVTQQGGIAVAPGGPGLEVLAFTWGSLQALEMQPEGRELRIDVPSGAGEVVVLVVQAADAQTLLRWTDPGWYPVAPNLGQALTPVALALLVALFRGGAGGEFVRAGKKRNSARDLEER